MAGLTHTERDHEFDLPRLYKYATFLIIASLGSKTTDQFLDQYKAHLAGKKKAKGKNKKDGLVEYKKSHIGNIKADFKKLKLIYITKKTDEHKKRGTKQYDVIRINYESLVNYFLDYIHNTMPEIDKVEMHTYPINILKLKKYDDFRVILSHQLKVFMTQIAKVITTNHIDNFNKKYPNVRDNGTVRIFDEEKQVYESVVEQFSLRSSNKQSEFNVLFLNNLRMKSNKIFNTPNFTIATIFDSFAYFISNKFDFQDTNYLENYFKNDHSIQIDFDEWSMTRREEFEWAYQEFLYYMKIYSVNKYTPIFLLEAHQFNKRDKNDIIKK
jgi:hypothetical protein